MEGSTTPDVRAAYDRVAAEYARRLFDELEHKPLDRALLDRFAARVQGAGPVCDVGCGPGHVTRYLHERGAQVVGLDLSSEMVAQARRLSPGIEFRRGDMLALEEEGVWGGIVAFYSLINLSRGEVVLALRRFRRALRPGGVLLLAFHVGEGTLHRDEWWGQAVSVDFVFFTPAEMAGYLRAAALEVEETVEREPYPDVEYPSRRCYIFARKHLDASRGPTE